MAEIRLEGVAHQYVRDEYALRDVELTWEHGGAYALLGPSGCGKTTMLDIISGLLTPSAGRVLFDGADVTGRTALERNIAQVFQFPVLYDSMTVEENMRFPLRNRGVARPEAQRRAEEVAELLDITHLLKRRARGLPADAKQLVSLGRGLVRRDVSAILFDEPLTVIDPQMRWTLRQALKRVHAELSHTLVYVTHDQTEALTFADVVVVMNEGEVMQRGTPDELFERPAHRFVGHFIGSPGMNFLPCTVGDGVVSVAGVAQLRLSGAAPEPDEGPDEDEGGCGGEATDTAGGGDVVGIRPDHVAVRSRPEPGSIEATVSRVRDLGATYLVDLATAAGDAPLVARVAAGDEVPATGSPCWAALRPGKAHLFRYGRLVPGVRPMAASVEGAA